ncbi:type II secretion system F family protein [Desulfovibrio ferrophilus]|uniref:Putative type II secretion system protein n=1 Tax=Desulfovibrio ferrophilus TaxID=241368 RepID=A0A2Z6AZ41_9BACT|nr:type II secretion system F family protein [Desulfovibrio ferrophilus]BBD08522.1 putative type II secretion system protein [Desulfovibrio ferrophilus]
MNYKYKAITDSGSPVTGTIAAENEAQAMQLIAAKGYIPQNVKAGGKSDAGDEPEWLEAINRKLAKVKAPELMLFTKQLRTMLDAGLPVTRALDVMEQQSENKKLKHAVIKMSQNIRLGSTMHQAFAQHPECFSELYINMIQAGEVSGNLSDVMERLAYLIDHEHKVKSKIKSAMTYPIIVVIALLGAFTFLLGFVIPQFVTLFAGAGIELPWPTKLCITMSEMLFAYWHVGVLGIIAFIAGLAIYCKTPTGRFQRDTLFLRIPIIGPVLRKAAMARFSSIFAILQSSGVSVLNSVSIISRTIGNAAISREFDNLESKLMEGRGISGPLQSSKHFTPMVINMIAIGEESGNLDGMLQEVATHYDYEVEYSVGRMSEMIGPILVLSLSGVVGFFALAIMLPIFELTKMTGL